MGACRTYLPRRRGTRGRCVERAECAQVRGCGGARGWHSRCQNCGFFAWVSMRGLWRFAPLFGARRVFGGAALTCARGLQRALQIEW